MTTNLDFQGTPFLTLNISETIQDRHMVTADHRQKAICGLLNSVVANAKVVSAFFV